MKKTLLSVFIFCILSLIAEAQNVAIPDANFKAYLVGEASINTNSDTEIQVSEATAFTGTIDCSLSSITDMTGIEAFTALTALYCYDNQITSLDLSQNTDLADLACSYNQLTSLDLSQNTALAYLDCGGNVLTTIDLSNNPLLEEINIGEAALTDLNLSQNPALSSLYCYNNSLTTLDLSFNTALTRLYCDSNLLTVLNLSQNLDLERLECNGNDIESLNLGAHSNLTRINCRDNSLTHLNLANGNNTNVTAHNFLNNPNLICIQVDDTTYSNNTWFGKDVTTSYSEDCGYTLINTISVQGQGGDSTMINLETLQMEASLLPANATFQTYTWSVTNGTGAASIDNNGLLTASATGTVTVTASATDGSGTTGSKTITIINQGVYVNTIAFDYVHVYPNPSSSIVYIEIGDNEVMTSIQLFDLTGKTIQSFSPTERQLDLNSIAKGIYFLEIANTEKKSTVKLIKE